MLQRVLNYVNQHGMLEQGNKVVVGVSGGADSVCLLFVLHRLSERGQTELEAAHVNHGLRGEEADRDQAYVEKLCRNWGIPFHLKKVNLTEIAREKKLTEEEAGRLVRYDFFRQVAKETGAERIAVGHNANDNAETLLFHLIRGTGLKGLGGIAPVQGDIIRPLLCLERKEIEEFLRKENLEFCMDRTNLEDTYSRNRIRHQLLGVMEEMNPEVVRAINRTALLCRESSQYIEKEAAYALQKYSRRKPFFSTEEVVPAPSGESGSQEPVVLEKEAVERLEPVVLEKEAVERLEPVVLDALLWQAIAQAAGSRKDLGSVHLEAVKSLWKGKTGKRLDLPCGLEAENQYGALLLRKKVKAEAVQGWDLPDPLGQGKLDLGNGACLLYSVEKYEKNMNIPKKRYTKWLDCDIIKGKLRFRTREPGDRIHVISSGGSQKIKDYFINEKIPRQERDKLLLLAEGHEILWVPGYRISEAYKVTEQTKRVLKVTYTVGGTPEEYT